MVNITFNSLDIHKRYEPADHFFLEIDYHGRTIRIDVGIDPHSERPDCVHIVGVMTMNVDQHSVNAADITFDPPHPTEKQS
jgi:hypothetical protein